MSNNSTNFVGELVPIKKTVIGIGKSTALMQGTLKWTFKDNKGKAHSFLLPGSLYTPDIPVQLLLPQHWAQHNRDRHAHCDTNADRIQLFWDGATQTVPLNAGNVGIMRSASGYGNATPVLSALSAMFPPDPTCFSAYCFPAQIIPPDHASNTNDSQASPAFSQQETTKYEGDDMDERSWNPPKDPPGLTSLVNFNLDDINIVKDNTLAVPEDLHSKEPSTV
jgi:hypothetical protein